MQHLINEGAFIQDDPWRLFESGDNQALPGHALLPVSTWSNSGEELLGSSLSFGAVINENESIEQLLPYLQKIEVIAFKFGKFADGRAFSLARILRDQFQFSGDIRAIGDFLPDQVNYMHRCGFTSFAARTEMEAKTLLEIKDQFTSKYQSDSIDKEPLFRRR